MKENSTSPVFTYPVIALIIIGRPHPITDIYSTIKTEVNTAQKVTIDQVTTRLTTSKNVLFPGHNHLLTTGTNDLLVLKR